jgi:hypothetical protein
MGAHAWMIWLTGLVVGFAVGSVGGCLITGVLASGSVYKRAAEMAQQIATPRMRSLRVFRMPRPVTSRHLGRIS